MTTTPDDKTGATVEQDVNAILKTLGTKLAHYMPVHRDAAIGAMMEIADRISASAIAAERERAAGYVEGSGGAIPGAVVFASLVSGNNMPCMSGDGRDRIHPHKRRAFDDATRSLADAIRSGEPS